MEKLMTQRTEHLLRQMFMGVIQELDLSPKLWFDDERTIGFKLDSFTLEDCKKVLKWYGELVRPSPPLLWKTRVLVRFEGILIMTKSKCHILFLEKRKSYIHSNQLTMMALF